MQNRAHSAISPKHNYNLYKVETGLLRTREYYDRTVKLHALFLTMGMKEGRSQAKNNEFGKDFLDRRT